MQKWIVKPCTLRELAELYKCPYKVFKRHLKPFKDVIGERNGYFYTIHQVMIIIEKLGPPPGDVEIIYPREMPTKK